MFKPLLGNDHTEMKSERILKHKYDHYNVDLNLIQNCILCTMFVSANKEDGFTYKKLSFFSPLSDHEITEWE